MNIAYIDSSFLVAAAFNEPSASVLNKRISGCVQFISSNLLAAEVRSAFAREDLEFPEFLLSSISWILPDRPLTKECVNGAEYRESRRCRFVACSNCALCCRRPLGGIFATLDHKQGSVASELGFIV